MCVCVCVCGLVTCVDFFLKTILRRYHTDLCSKVGLLASPDRLVGLVVKASAPRVEDPGFESRLRRDFSGVESYQ